MNIIQYLLPISAVLLLVLFFMGLPRLKSCVLPGPSLAPETGDTKRLTRLDLFLMLMISLVYAFVAFWGLGDSQAPESFTDMSGKSALISLEEDSPPSGIMLYTGIGIGSYSIEYSADGESFVPVLEFEQTHAQVLKWHSLLPDTELVPRYIRVTAVSGSPWLGELSLLDGDGELIPISADIPALCDEQALTPASSNYMNSSYFDEIYHARTAWEHLNGIQPYEISHPPLGKIIISIGISIFGMDPFGWRFMGTLAGVLMLPLLYLLLKKLFGGSLIPALGCFVFATDFMHFVQTRIATIDSYGVLFILMMYLFMYIYLSEGKLWALGLSGIAFGLGAASKWICLYAGAGLGLIWAIHWALRFIELRRQKKAGENGEALLPAFLKNCLFCLGFFVLIPLLIYYFSYLPYGKALGVSPFSGEYMKTVWDNQVFMFTYHSGVVAEHPYSSRWYQWVLDIRPILYYLEYFDNGERSSICAFVGPALCWGGLLSLFVLGYTAVFRRDRKAAFILLGYFAQLVPWMFISRITFEYHYFPASLFLLLALCYVFKLFLDNKKNWALYLLPFAGACLLLFILFYPALSGVPVDNARASALLGWLPTWPI